jgi:antirestriction protein
MSYDPNWKEQPDLMGELYDEAMEILRQDFGSDLLSDADLPESEWDMDIDEADSYAFDEEECARDFYVDPKF